MDVLLISGLALGIIACGIIFYNNRRDQLRLERKITWDYNRGSRLFLAKRGQYVNITYISEEMLKEIQRQARNGDTYLVRSCIPLKDLIWFIDYELEYRNHLISEVKLPHETHSITRAEN